MHILWLSHLLPYPPRSGVQLRSFNLMKELSKYHDVELLAFNQVDLVAEADVAESVRALDSYCRVIDVVPMPSASSPIGRFGLAGRSLVSKYPYTLNWLRSHRFAQTLAECMKRRRYDAAHFDTISLAPYRELTRPLPASMTHHNIESEMLLRRAKLEANPFLRAYYWQEGLRLRKFERDSSGLFDVHITCSSLDAERLRRIASAAVTTVVPNGVDTQYFSPTEFVRERQPRSMVFAGGLDWYPNSSAVKFLVQKIWPLVKAKWPDSTVTIIGRKPPPWLLQAAAADSAVNALGFVDDVRPHVASAEVYVCPIFDGGGTKLKILDALAMGIPIVAHPVACEGIDVIDDQHVLLAKTPDQFIRQLSRLFEDPQLRTRLSQAGRHLAETRYEYKEIGRDLAGLYERLAGAAPGSCPVC